MTVAPGPDDPSVEADHGIIEVDAGLAVEMSPYAEEDVNDGVDIYDMESNIVVLQWKSALC